MFDEELESLESTHSESVIHAEQQRRGAVNSPGIYRPIAVQRMCNSRPILGIATISEAQLRSTTTYSWYANSLRLQDANRVASHGEWPVH